MQKIGKYDVLEKIGVGGFGEVYKGYDPFIKRYVAIKTCTTSDPDVRSRFFHEAEIAGNLHHRNITTVYDFGVQTEGLREGLPYLIQEYLSGEDLDRKIKRRDYLPFPEKLYYLLQIARGLGHAHANGVIHRDIKPANIRILEDGVTKIMDFGIAKLAQQETGLTQTGMTLGTAAYLAPEQIRGEPVDHRTDVFSFGILAFELLTYERPFRGRQISVVLHQILDLEPPSLSEKWPGAPPEMVTFVDRCLRKDAEQRYADGNELLQELERIQKQGRREMEEISTVRLSGDELKPDATGTSGLRTPSVGIAAAPSPAARPSADRPATSRTAPPTVPPTRAFGSLPARPQPPAGRSTIDDVEFSLGDAAAEPGEAPPPRPTASRVRGVMLLLALAALAVGGGWWLGSGGRVEDLIAGAETAAPPAGDEPPAAEPAVEIEPPAAAGAKVTEAAAGGDGSEPTAVEETAAQDAGDPGAEEASPPPAEEPAPPPPPPPPAKGRVVVEPVTWTDRMTLLLAGKTYPLTRSWDFDLAPGTYEATFELKSVEYPARQSVAVQIAAGGKTTLRTPIPEPGAVSVRPLPGRPQGEVWVDGELLQQSPVIRSLMAPGEYRIEIRPLGGDGGPLSETFSIQSGQETILTFDLGQGQIQKRSKTLDP